MKKLLIFSWIILTTIAMYAHNGNLAPSVSIRTNLPIISAYVENSNIFIRYADKSTKQLTFANSDSSPQFLKNENAVLFIRNAQGDINNPKVKKIMKVNCNSLIEKTITDKKPFRDGISDTYYILNIQDPTLSLDEQYLYFTTEAFATTDELVKVELRTGIWSKIFPAQNFELIKKGPYKNLFLVGKSQIKGGGRDTYYYLVNEKNETLKEFDSEDNYRLFKKSVIDK